MSKEIKVQNAGKVMPRPQYFLSFVTIVLKNGIKTTATQLVMARDEQDAQNTVMLEVHRTTPGATIIDNRIHQTLVSESLQIR